LDIVQPLDRLLQTLAGESPNFTYWAHVASMDGPVRPSYNGKI
jgi:hypothetical protein